MLPSVAFDEVAHALATRGGVVHASEAHGCLCGALCVRQEYLLREWLDELLPEAPASAEAEAAGGPLGDLHERSRADLAAADMVFEPLLPDDDQPLPLRVEALGAWCQGFLYGFGASGARPREPLPADVAEALADLAEISPAGAVGSASAEVEEDAYAELVEFLRVAVQLIHDELAGLRHAQPPRNTSH